jgi:hypothetical protein
MGFRARRSGGVPCLKKIFKHGTPPRPDILRSPMFEQIPIYQFPDHALEQRQYAFPFSFILPKDCPPSTFWTGSNKSVAFVKYHILAKLIPTSDSVDKMKSIHRLVVRQVAPKAQQN